jgi:glutaredoxin 3
MARVVLYTTAICAYCFLAKRLLDRRGIAYEERSLTRRSSDRDELAMLARGGRTFPQIFIDGEPIGGFAELRRLDRDGTLGRLLASGH